jgi:hypothetical protein
MNGGINFKLKDIAQLFARVKLLSNDSYVNVDKQVLEGCAVELATEVCNSNTAEKLVYTIQQLMFNEHDQQYRPDGIDYMSVRENLNSTTFRDLEPWAIQASNGTVTVDTDKLQAACTYLDKLMSYNRYDHQWANTLLLLNEGFFTKDTEHRVNEVLSAEVLCYRGKTDSVLP